MSMRHDPSNANFSLNSDDLRHGGFQQYGHNLANGPSDESKVSSARRHLESNKNIRLPNIEKRKKSYEVSIDSEYRKMMQKINHP